MDCSDHGRAKMNPELKAKWIAALRSGEYKQVTARLRTREGYCCLGVLCMVAGVPITEDGSCVEGENSKAGYQTIFDMVGGDDAGRSLYERNDSGASFSEIADYIEKNL